DVSVAASLAPASFFVLPLPFDGEPDPLDPDEAPGDVGVTSPFGALDSSGSDPLLHAPRPRPRPRRIVAIEGRRKRRRRIARGLTVTSESIFLRRRGMF